MTDPYKVLNIPHTATDEEVKRAYRELARKYHPDNYNNNPLADLAQEKMKEINEAYDTITRQRSSGGSTCGDAGRAYSSYGPDAGGAAFRQVRAAIGRDDLHTAEHILSIISDHNGEWHFLKGAICCRRGWLEEGLRYYETACRLSPGNREYQEALERLRGSTGGYRPSGYPVFTTDCGGEGFCRTAACFYCCCNMCMGFRFFF